MKGLYIVANSALEDWNPLPHGCDAVNLVLIGNLYRGLPPVKNAIYRRLKNQFIKRPRLAKAYKNIFNKPVQVYDYSDVTPFLLSGKTFEYDCYPCVIPNWDNSPRSGINSLILKNSTPAAFEKHLQEAVKLVEHNPPQKKLVFIKSWNEWAEGNHLEPDSIFGTRYLDVLKNNLIA